MIRRRLRCLTPIAVLALVAGCSGHTVVGEREPATTPAEATGAGWWPPDPQPQAPQEPTTAPTAPSQDETTGEPPAPEHPPPTEPGHDPTLPADPAPEETPSQDPQHPSHPPPFTYPGWEEDVYDARNGDAPAAFRDRSAFRSCGDFAGEEGSDLISPTLAECLDGGKEPTDGEKKVREGAIAVLAPSGQVAVWFVRVGPDTSEYFLNRNGRWLHSTCDPTVSIGVLACEEPIALVDEDPAPDPDPSEPPTDDPTEGGEGSSGGSDDGSNSGEESGTHAPAPDDSGQDDSGQGDSGQGESGQGDSGQGGTSREGPITPRKTGPTEHGDEEHGGVEQ